jgi:hypothetical protein
MADQEHLNRLRAGVSAWNQWRADNPDIIPFLNGASLRKANFRGVDLHLADLTGADLIGADLSGAVLTDAYAQMADFRHADLTRALMGGIDLGSAMLGDATLRGAQMKHAFVAGADLLRADLRDADLSDADLSYVQLAEAKIEGAMLTGARVYGISAWGLNGKPRDQSRLIITAFGDSPITVDELELAQFVYLILNNANITKVFNTVDGKAVLILGRFTDDGQNTLAALYGWLRHAHYVPIIFNFERPIALDFTETVKLLVGMSRFVIADIGKPRSVQQELQAIVPDFEKPVAPIIRVGEEPWSMFRDIERRKWVLKLVSYSDDDHLLQNLQRLVNHLEDMHDQIVAEKSRPDEGPTPINQM